MMNWKLVDAFRFFASRGTGWVGRNAEAALRLARAELTAKAVGLRFVWEEDPEPFECDCGHPACEDRQAYGCVAYATDEDGEPAGTPLDSLWRITFTGPGPGEWGHDREQSRGFEADVALEALERVPLHCGHCGARGEGLKSLAWDVGLARCGPCADRAKEEGEANFLGAAVAAR